MAPRSAPKGSANGLNVVTITGEIVVGDLQVSSVPRFSRRADCCCTSKPRRDRYRRFGHWTYNSPANTGTAVPDGAACASVCGLIWLAGSPRLLAASSKIGFHAAYREDGSESGQANALVGAYLSRLGLSYRAIAFVTERGSDGMNWLHPSDAAGIGISYTLITPPKPETLMPPPPLDPQNQLAPQSLPPAAPVASPAAPQARRLVLAYYALWSQGGGNWTSGWLLRVFGVVLWNTDTARES